MLCKQYVLDKINVYFVTAAQSQTNTLFCKILALTPSKQKHVPEVQDIVELGLNCEKSENSDLPVWSSPSAPGPRSVDGLSIFFPYTA